MLRPSWRSAHGLVFEWIQRNHDDRLRQSEPPNVHRAPRHTWDGSRTGFVSHALHAYSLRFGLWRQRYRRFPAQMSRLPERRSWPTLLAPTPCQPGGPGLARPTPAVGQERTVTVVSFPVGSRDDEADPNREADPDRAVSGRLRSRRVRWSRHLGFRQRIRPSRPLENGSRCLGSVLGISFDRNSPSCRPAYRASAPSEAQGIGGERVNTVWLMSAICCRS